MMATAGRSAGEPARAPGAAGRSRARAAGGRCAWPAALLLAALAAACGGDSESAADGEAAPDSADGDVPPSSEGEEAVAPGAEGEVRENGDAPPDAPADASGGLGGIEADGPRDDFAPEPVRTTRIAAGTRIDVVADADISTAAYRVGDPVVATVIRDVRGPGGERLLPQGVRLLGRVKASAGSGGPGERPVLEIAFETLSAYSYERPVEGVVVNAPVILDPAAARARRSASGRVAAVTEVPGLIVAGTVIAVELRDPVEVPPFAAPADPVPRGDSAQEADSAVRDTLERGGLAGVPVLRDPG
ncbi:MAG: hypothetical protein OXU64_10115 [Gemmatimonadota bacterium]|nr:hypothetical protein [Gemmatimonadota bacterium]